MTRAEHLKMLGFFYGFFLPCISRTKDVLLSSAPYRKMSLNKLKNCGQEDVNGIVDMLYGINIVFKNSMVEVK